MTVRGLRSYFQSLQTRKGFFNLGKNILNPQDRCFSLQGRAASVDFVARVWKQYAVALTSGTKDRTHFKIPVCQGIPGLGKTRMIEEAAKLLAAAGVTGPSSWAVVTYGNGHGPTAQLMDSYLPIVASFSWRLLHWLFLEDNATDGNSFNSWFTRERCPSNARDLTLDMALNVVAAEWDSAAECDSAERLSLCLGLDEYQVPTDRWLHPSVGQDAPLEDLITAIIGCIQQPPSKLRVYPLLAGTGLTRNRDAADSSHPDTVRVPMPPLPPTEVAEAIINSDYTRTIVSSATVRRYLFFLGGVPRPCCEFATQVADSHDPSADAISVIFKEVYQFRVTESWRWSIGGTLSLVAHALCGRSVNPTEVVTVTREGDTEATKYTWRRLADVGACWLDSTPEGESRGRPHVSYHMVRWCSQLTQPDVEQLPEAHKAFVDVLTYMRLHLDDQLYDVDAWRAWEIFGACFHALRINALQIINPSTRHVQFSSLFPGAKMAAGCDCLVQLRPMRVMAMEGTLSRSTPAAVSECGNALSSRNWQNEGWVVINGTNGEAVDLFFSLPLTTSAAPPTPATSNPMVVFLDQRKHKATHDNVASLLDAAMRVAPANLPVGSHIIAGVFNPIYSYLPKAKDATSATILPNNSLFVSFAEHSEYHGCLSTHPAATPLIDINTANKSTLLLLKSICQLAGQNADARRRRVVDRIITRRSSNPFTTYEEFSSFLQKDLGVTPCDADEPRCIAHASPS